MFLLLVDDLNLGEPLDVVGGARHDQLLAKEAPVVGRALLDGAGQVDVVAVPVRPLDGRHVVPVPVVADEAADEQLAPEVVLFRGRERVVDEQRVPDGLVDDSVEDVCQ
jgi:hypothetical protein